eukprot:m.309718 g.309718  ORF g.309718 m.309718 type:complete len:487 (+) comp20201_c0_seq4:251-1711(+)
MSGWKFCHPLPPDPSITDGVDAKKVDRYRRDGPEFIKNIAVELNLHSNVYNTGIVFYHRFYQRHSFNKYKRWYLAAACLFVAGKVEEQPKKLKDLLPWVYKYYPRKPGEPPRRSAELGQKLFQEMKAQVLANECALLKTLQFDFVVQHPPEFLFRFAKALRLSSGDRIPNELVQLAFKYITDSFKTTLCMEYPPDAIAVSLLFLASRKQKVDVVARVHPGTQRRLSTGSKAKNETPWWETFVSGSSAHMQDICDRIVQFYEKTNSANSAVAVDSSEIGTPGTPSSSTPYFDRTATPVVTTCSTPVPQNPSPATTPSVLGRVPSNHSVGTAPFINTNEHNLAPAPVREQPVAPVHEQPLRPPPTAAFQPSSFTPQAPPSQAPNPPYFAPPPHQPTHQPYPPPMHHQHMAPPAPPPHAVQRAPQLPPPLHQPPLPVHRAHPPPPVHHSLHVPMQTAPPPSGLGLPMPAAAAHGGAPPLGTGTRHHPFS